MYYNDIYFNKLIDIIINSDPSRIQIADISDTKGILSFIMI